MGLPTTILVLESDMKIPMTHDQENLVRELVPTFDDTEIQAIDYFTATRFLSLIEIDKRIKNEPVARRTIKKILRNWKRQQVYLF